MKRAIYVGPGMRRRLLSPVTVNGVGMIEETSINYGRTGYAYRISGRRWDFRPDDINLRHEVPKKHLYFV